MNYSNDHKIEDQTYKNQILSLDFKIFEETTEIGTDAFEGATLPEESFYKAKLSSDFVLLFSIVEIQDFVFKHVTFNQNFVLPTVLNILSKCSFYYAIFQLI